MPGTTVTDESANDDLQVIDETKVEVGTDAVDTPSVADESTDTPAEDEGELSITLGDDPAPTEEAEEATASPVIRTLRQENKEKTRAIRKTEAELKAARDEIERLKGSTSAAPKLGPKPSMSDEGIDYDEQVFEAKLQDWVAKKATADAEAQRAIDAQAEQNKVWQGRFDAVTSASKALKVMDLDDAVESFDATFNAMQRGIIMGGPDDPKQAAQLRYALGRSPAVAQKLAAIKDPVKFTFAIKDQLDKMKVTPRTAPTPERVVRSNVPGAASATDNVLEKLREEAAKSGNYSKVIAHKNELKKRAA